jgi:hypothetical protein
MAFAAECPGARKDLAGSGSLGNNFPGTLCNQRRNLFVHGGFPVDDIGVEHGFFVSESVGIGLGGNVGGGLGKLVIEGEQGVVKDASKDVKLGDIIVARGSDVASGTGRPTKSRGGSWLMA